jgi:hypothetical protein
VKNEVPSFISSATMRPLRFDITPYTLPKTSAGKSASAGQLLSQWRHPLDA